MERISRSDGDAEQAHEDRCGVFLRSKSGCKIVAIFLIAARLMRGVGVHKLSLKNHVGGQPRSWTRIK